MLVVGLFGHLSLCESMLALGALVHWFLFLSMFIVFRHILNRGIGPSVFVCEHISTRGIGPYVLHVSMICSSLACLFCVQA